MNETSAQPAPAPTSAPAPVATLAPEVAPRVVLLQVEAECLLARQLLVGVQIELLQCPQLPQFGRDRAGQLVRVQPEVRQCPQLPQLRRDGPVSLLLRRESTFRFRADSC